MPPHFAFALEVTQFGIYPGSSPATQAASMLIAASVADQSFGAAFDALEVNLHFRYPRRSHPAFTAADLARYHRLLDAMPKVTLRKQARRIEIACAAPFGFEPYRRDALSPPGFDKLAAEVLRALEALRPYTRRLADFTLDAFVAKLAAGIAAVPRAPAAFAAQLDAASAAAQARWDATVASDPWAPLGIDWSTYHRSARSLLDDPWFWDPGDDHAPVGNDTGADVLASYRSWRRRKAGRAGALDSLERMLTAWDMHDGSPDDELTRDEAFIALAFAQAMLDGTITAAVIDRALASLTRQAARAEAWPDPAQRAMTLAKMRAAIESIRDRPV